MDSSSTREWTVERRFGDFGAVVHGLDLAAPLAADDHAALVELLAEHLVLVFPDQSIDHTRQVALGRVFGEPLVHPFLESVPGHPEILTVVKEPSDHGTFGGEFWHADITFLDPPSSVSLLYSEVVPPVGGDTLFADQFAAFSALPPDMQVMLENRRAVHLYPGMTEEDGHATAVHPVVRVHPVSGRRALYVNPAFVTRFADMSEAASQRLLEFLHEHQVRPEFRIRVGWDPRQLTVWDNRAVLHHATDDYAGHRRVLRRVTSMEREA